jgi:aerobic-type carbon monoxide dehydrogenase small subunit (CoxS/CutS family)
VSDAPRPIRFRVNGRAVEGMIAPHQSLVEVLREQFDLFGAR